MIFPKFPPNEQAIVARVHAALATLSASATPDEVAEKLRAAGARGYPRSALSCPVARFLNAAALDVDVTQIDYHGDNWVVAIAPVSDRSGYVVSWRVSAYVGPLDGWQMLEYVGPAVAGFLSAFDEGTAFLDLVEVQLS